jgi:sugar lactone lactonase YvrE
MFEIRPNLFTNGKRRLKLFFLLILVLTVPLSSFGGKKKKADDTPPKPPPVIDYSNIVWPNPPAIARIRYKAFYSAQSLAQVEADAPKSFKKQSWMDRLAGTQTESEHPHVLFQLAQPYGMAVDSKGQLYVSDTKVGAIFIFNTETRYAELIKNGQHAHFVRIIGLAMDDNDRLFVADPGLRHVLVLNAKHETEEVITDAMAEPSMLAIDTNNRLLYVSDVKLDQVLVYDADTFKLLRKMGTAGHNHELTAPGDFAKPTGVAVDTDGNLYVCDTLNNRIEIFDADGRFIKTFGKSGDGPGYFARPKGIAIDADGNIWVADGMQDRVQVFNQDNQLLITFGGHGLLPGQFQSLVNVISDSKRNRIFTAEIFPGRTQEFQYVTNAQADQLRKEREDLRQKKADEPKQAPANAPTSQGKAPGGP